jgi:D-threonate/D-erythronate kinase
MRAGIQADDLTGGCDTGAVFAARGLRTVVLLPDAPLPAPPPEILVLDTESRGRGAAEARARARAAALRLASCAPARLYKKVDSTLRGAIAAELAGVLEGAGRRGAILAPSLPAQRRTVTDGVLRIGGQPAGETAIARDPTFPPTGDRVLALLGAAGPHPAGLVPLATVRRGPAAVAARLTRFDAILVCDAESDEDLGVLAAAGERVPVLLAGSAGLAAALAARMAGEPARRAPRPPASLLVVAGSAHPVSRAQVARLQSRGIAGIWAPADARGDRDAIVSELAEAARREVERAVPGSLLLTGGETAYSVCRALGAEGIALAGEVEPGLAIGALLGGPFAGLAVVTKAGSFGDPETLLRLYEACR